LRPNFINIMKKVFNLILLATLSVFVFSCNKNDDDEITPVRDYAEQYATDIETIKDFLKTHSITVVNNPGFIDDQDISFTEVSELSASSIWGSDDATHKPELLEWPVEKDGFTYIIYYLQLRQGTGTNSKSPCNYDNVLTAYKGFLIDEDVTNFQTNANPQDFFNLGTTIRGWSEILPKFKTGSYVPNANGTLAYTDFGAGVIFVPSGLAYFNGAPTNIPSYSPLIFGFKLLEIQRIDHDGDGIYSYQEDINGDGYLRDNDTTHEDDTDQDGKPDFVDDEDDGDSFLTRYETEYLIGGAKYYYPYDGDLVDNPLTAQDETKGIPRAFTGPLANPSLPESSTNRRQPLPEDYTATNRLRRHLDVNCKPPYQ
jgi:FKBP-type peptidyl-prolyl cis-trans isomerase FkpA